MITCNLSADFADAILRLKSQGNAFHPFQHLVGGVH